MLRASRCRPIVMSSSSESPAVNSMLLCSVDCCAAAQGPAVCISLPGGTVADRLSLTAAT